MDKFGPSEKMLYRQVGKRLFDIGLSLAVLLGFSWLYGLVALVVWLETPRAPVIFRQRRVGKDGVPFTIYKFRSMRCGAETEISELRPLNEKSGPVFKMHDDPRVTRVGRLLRKTSLDELPQFVNVLRGDMSVVGPRPALPCEVEEYTEYQRLRLREKPGLTCYWQVQPNRDAVPFDEWVGLDLLYLQTCSFRVDCKLIVKTIAVTITAQGS